MSTITTFLEKGLSKNTLTNYTKGVQIWIQYLTSCGFVTDPSHPLLRWSCLSLSKQVQLIISYIMCLHEEQRWTSKRISTNISGVRDFVRRNLLDLNAFNHESISLALKATQPDSRTTSLLRETKKRLPVTAEMVSWYKNKCWRFGAIASSIDIDQRMTFLGVAIGLTFLRRVSEYTYDGRSQHTILAEDVHFISKHNPPVAIPSFDVPRTKFELNDVSTMRFIFRTSKTDQGGRGTYLFLQAKNHEEFDLIKCFMHWCKIAGLEVGVPFLSRLYQGRRKTLRPNMVNAALKEIADDFGFQDVRNAFTSHSLRIGGATALIASGSTRETVQRIGGWSTAPTSSDSIYALNTPGRNSNLWSALKQSSQTNVSVNDIHSIIPPTNKQRR